jgi:cytoskeletal protein RodZ
MDDSTIREEPSRILEKETLGSYLRKTRIGNGVDLARMAQKTRIHAELIQAIEKDEYDKLPGVTYNKLFIKSIARYLELNPDEIYKRYLNEHPEMVAFDAPTGTSFPKYEDNVQTKESAVAPDASETKTPVKNPFKTILPILLLVAAGAALLLLSPKEKKEQTSIEYSPAIDSVEESIDQQYTEPESVTPQNVQTSSEATETALTPPESTAISDANVEAQPAIEEIKLPPITKRYIDETDGAITADFICTKGNISVSALRNGNVWTNYLSEGHAKKFASDSAIYLRLLGSGEGIVIINGVSVPVKPEPNRFVLRIDKNGSSWTTLKTWNSVIPKQ